MGEVVGLGGSRAILPSGGRDRHILVALLTAVLAGATVDTRAEPLPLLPTATPREQSVHVRLAHIRPR